MERSVEKQYFNRRVNLGKISGNTLGLVQITLNWRVGNILNGITRTMG